MKPTVWRSAVCWVWQVLSSSTSEDKKNRLLPALQQHCNSGIILEISTVVWNDLQISEQNELVWILNNPISAAKIPCCSPSSPLDNNEKTNKQTKAQESDLSLCKRSQQPPVIIRMDDLEQIEQSCKEWGEQLAQENVMSWKFTPKEQSGQEVGNTDVLQKQRQEETSKRRLWTLDGCCIHLSRRRAFFSCMNASSISQKRYSRDLHVVSANLELNIWVHLFLTGQAEEWSNCCVKSSVNGVSVPFDTTVGSIAVTDVVIWGLAACCEFFSIGLDIHWTLPEWWGVDNLSWTL